MWGGHYIRILSMGKPFYKEALCEKPLHKDSYVGRATHKDSL